MTPSFAMARSTEWLSILPSITTLSRLVPTGLPLPNQTYSPPPNLPPATTSRPQLNSFLYNPHIQEALRHYPTTHRLLPQSPQLIVD